MIRINLLPVRKLKKRLQARNLVIGFVVSLMVLAAGLTFTAMHIKGQIKTLEATKAAKQAEKASFDAILAEIGQLKKDKEALELKLGIIRNLKRGSLLTVRVLDEIANLTPPSRMWILSLSQSPTQVTISGIALDNATIAQYMRSIAASPIFASVDLASSAVTDIAGKKLKSFGMTLNIQQSPAPEDTAKTAQ